jgi:hypothetical protein
MSLTCVYRLVTILASEKCRTLANKPGRVLFCNQLALAVFARSQLCANVRRRQTLLLHVVPVEAQFTFTAIIQLEYLFGEEQRLRYVFGADVYARIKIVDAVAGHIAAANTRVTVARVRAVFD